MGQSNYPTLSRTGLYMHWYSTWDNLFNYTKLLHKNVFLKKIIILLFTDKLSSSVFFYKKNSESLKSDLIFNLENTNINLNQFFKKKTFPFMYFGKIWFLKIQNWVIISLYVYVSKKIKKQIKKQTKNSKYKNIIFFLYLIKNNHINIFTNKFNF